MLDDLRRRPDVLAQELSLFVEHPS